MYNRRNGYRGNVSVFIPLLFPLLTKKKTFIPFIFSPFSKWIQPISALLKKSSRVVLTVFNTHLRAGCGQEVLKGGKRGGRQGNQDNKSRRR